MKNNLFKRLFNFYYEGFKGMTVGKKLWVIIIIKLLIFFAILRPIFFQNYLNTNFHSDKEKSNHIINQLTK